jgi:hypothetical protein
MTPVWGIDLGLLEADVLRNIAVKPDMAIFQKFFQIVETQNQKNGLFKVQFNLGHLFTIVGLLLVIIPMWIGMVSDNAVSRETLKQTTASLEDIKLHLNSIDKTATMALVDDDRLLRVQADVKEINARVQEIERRLHENAVRGPSQ